MRSEKDAPRNIEMVLVTFDGATSKVRLEVGDRFDDLQGGRYGKDLKIEQ